MRLVSVERCRAASDRADRRGSDGSNGAITRAAACAQLPAEDLSGYVLKKDSPSCGLERVKIYGEHGVAARSGRGLFASRLVERFRIYPSKKKAGCRIRGFARTSSSVCSHTGGSAACSAADGTGWAGALSHGAQTDPDGALACRLSAARSPGRWRAVHLAPGHRGTLHRRVHGRARGARHASAAGERAAAHAGLLQGPARRDSKAELLPPSRTIGASSFRSSCRSP